MFPSKSIKKNPSLQQIQACTCWKRFAAVIKVKASRTQLQEAAWVAVPWVQNQEGGKGGVFFLPSRQSSPTGGQCLQHTSWVFRAVLQHQQGSGVLDRETEAETHPHKLEQPGRGGEDTGRGPRQCLQRACRRSSAPGRMMTRTRSDLTR